MAKFLFTLPILLSCTLGFSKDLLMECGGTSRNPFNGWSIHPFNVFDNVVFSDESIGFFIENGGDYTVSLTRKIEAMRNYALLDLTLKVDAVENCKVNHVDLYVSADGHNWSLVPVDPNNNHTTIANPGGQFKYLRFAINISARGQGYLECSYFKMEGDNEPVIEEIEPAVEEISFFVFCFNKSINVETKSEDQYEIVLCNLAGQIVHSETTIGSTRIETDLPEGVYVVSVIQDGEIKQTKKVVF